MTDQNPRTAEWGQSQDWERPPGHLTPVPPGRRTPMYGPEWYGPPEPPQPPPPPVPRGPKVGYEPWLDPRNPQFDRDRARRATHSGQYNPPPGFEMAHGGEAMQGGGFIDRLRGTVGDIRDVVGGVGKAADRIGGYLTEPFDRLYGESRDVAFRDVPNLVGNWADRLGVPIGDLLKNPHFQDTLEQAGVGYGLWKEFFNQRPGMFGAWDQHLDPAFGNVYHFESPWEGPVTFGDAGPFDPSAFGHFWGAGKQIPDIYGKGLVDPRRWWGDIPGIGPHMPKPPTTGGGDVVPPKGDPAGPTTGGEKFEHGGEIHETDANESGEMLVTDSGQKVVNEPTHVIFGEAGPEAIVPMNNPFSALLAKAALTASEMGPFEDEKEDRVWEPLQHGGSAGHPFRRFEGPPLPPPPPPSAARKLGGNIADIVNRGMDLRGRLLGPTDWLDPLYWGEQLVPQVGREFERMEDASTGFPHTVFSSLADFTAGLDNIVNSEGYYNALDMADWFNDYEDPLGRPGGGDSRYRKPTPPPPLPPTNPGGFGSSPWLRR